MAGLAGDFTSVAAVVQRDSVFAQGRRPPGLVGMTVFAARAKEPGMDCRFFMAGNAFCRCAAELIIFMAVCAL